MKLYRVEVTKVVYVVAEDALEAELEGPRYAAEDDGKSKVEVDLATVRGIKADGWGGALVYGDHHDDYLSLDAVKLND